MRPIALAFSLALFIRAQTFTEYNIPTPGSQPYAITPGPDGNLWFTEWAAGKIGKVTPSGAVIDYQIPSESSALVQPVSIATGPDGALWFAASGNLGRITTSGTVTLHPLPGGASPDWIVSGPDGNLWFTVSNGQIGKSTTAGVMTFYHLPSSGTFSNLIVGPDGNFWAGDTSSNQLLRITTAGAIREFPLQSSVSAPSDLIVGPDNLFWGLWSGGISKITTSALYTITFALTAQGAQSLTTGPDGAVWFLDNPGNKVGRVTTTGQFFEYTIPTQGSQPWNMTLGPDQALWFTERGPGANKIGRFVVPFTPPPPSGPTILPNGIVNASSSGAALAPGAIAAIYTSALDTQPATFNTPTLPPSLSGVTVTFGNIPAPMVSVSPGGANPFVSAQVPFEVPLGKTAVMVSVNNASSAAVNANIVASAPAIYTIPPTGSGNAILVYVDPATNQATIAAPVGAQLGYPVAPITRGTQAFFYVNGLGVMTPGVIDGSGDCPDANGCSANSNARRTIRRSMAIPVPLSAR